MHDRAGLNDTAKEYAERGVTVVRGLLHRAAIDRLLREFRRLAASPPFFWKDQTDRGDPGRFVSAAFLWRVSEEIRNLALCSPVSELAAYLMGLERPRLFYDQLFFKAAGTTTRTRWHRDLPFWPFRGTDIPSFWVALTSASERSSAVIYWPGSHHARSSREKAALASDRISFDLAPGDVVIHHPLIIHGAPGNRSREDRIALSLRYLGQDVRWNADPHRMFVPKASGRLMDGEVPLDGDVFPQVSRLGGSMSN